MIDAELIQQCADPSLKVEIVQNSSRRPAVPTI